MEVDYDAEEESLLAATAKAWGTAVPGLARPTGDAVEVRASAALACYVACILTAHLNRYLRAGRRGVGTGLTGRHPGRLRTPPGAPPAATTRDRTPSSTSAN